MDLTIKKDLAPTVAGTNGFGNKNQKRKVTVHLTGNREKGANAKMHAKLQKTIYPASWHIQTDGKESIQSFEYSWQCYHTGDGAGDGNKHSIGIEGCINVDGDYVKMIHNLAETGAIVVRDNSLDPVKDVVRHYDWSGKHCPFCLLSKASLKTFRFSLLMRMLLGRKERTKGITACSENLSQRESLCVHCPIRIYWK